MAPAAHVGQDKQAGGLMVKRRKSAPPRKREKRIAQADVEQFNNAPPSDNPDGPFTDVIVNIPQNITVRMVNAIALDDYEIWVFISSLICNFFVGFAVAYFQALEAKSANVAYIGWTTLAFAALTLVALFVALRKRMSLREKGKDIRLKVASATQKPIT